MGEIYIIDKSKADTLLSHGFRYTIKKIDGKKVFSFIQTDELMKEIIGTFDRESFFINHTVNF